MTGINPGAASSFAVQWEAIDWSAIEAKVNRLQMRIAKAKRENRLGKVHSLQWLLTHSYAAKLLAIKRVTSSSGKNTAGVDGQTLVTAKQKMTAVKSLKRRGYQALPLRRVYIPKKDSKRRPLGIPTIIDRAQQALHLLALDPVAETVADPNSYGFRPYRSCHDAIEKCFNLLAKKGSSKWILEGDIKACFDCIDHTWLMENIPIDRRMLSQWLKAGYLEKQILYPTLAGTPQGGIISPVLANMALDGLEHAVKSAVPKRAKVYMVRYADDFVITGSTKEVLEGKIKPVVSKFLRERGLALSASKTQITHIEAGFDFLGFNIRKYSGTLLIKPAKANVKAFLAEIRKQFKTGVSDKTEHLINRLNPKIKGWVYYYRHVVSKKVFGRVDHEINAAIIRWIKRRHPMKNWTWRKRKYFRTQRFNQWIFTAKSISPKGKQSNTDLFLASSLPIIRHVKIRCMSSKYDPAYTEYFKKREKLKEDVKQNHGVSLLRNTDKLVYLPRFAG